MTPKDADVPGLAAHWDDAYRRGEATRSWFQQHADMSIRMLRTAGVGSGDSVIDVGGGASRLSDDLIASGYADLTVLDISTAALVTAQNRLAASSNSVTWLHADLREWTPHRVWKVWHDRAVLHFFTTDEDQQRYLAALNRSTGPGSYAVIATFAPDGPSECSGLTVARYDSSRLSTLLGGGWHLVDEAVEQHYTPAGGTQSFTWALFHRER